MDERRLYTDGTHIIPINDYHASHGISRSGLMEFKRSPHHFWYKRYNPVLDVNSNSPALCLGDLVHTLVLEPHKFDDEFIVQPKLDRRTNAGKFMFNQFQATVAGRVPVTYEQVELANVMKVAVLGDKFASELLSYDSLIENSIYFTHKLTGIQCKVRPDVWLPGIVLDLKTSNDASFKAFQNSAVKFGYFLQAGMIHQAFESLGKNLEKFIFIVVEKDAPYAVATYVLDDEAIDFGVCQFNSLMKSYARCLQNELWPSYGFKVLSVPKWADNDTESILDDSND